MGHARRLGIGRQPVLGDRDQENVEEVALPVVGQPAVERQEEEVGEGDLAP
jgi:hypothetical protein